MSELRTTNLTKSYRGADGDIPVLTDVSLSFETGKMHAVVGPSGCGKSTLLMLCGGLIRPDTGSIWVGEENLSTMPARTRERAQAELVGFVFQQFHLIPYLDVEENIMVSCLARPVSEARPRCQELIERLGLGHRRGHIPAKLSSGEQQRVALGRALMNRPKVLIADEPTGNLDGGNTDHLLGLMREFADDGGLVLLATHEPGVAERADRVYGFRDGGVEELERNTGKGEIA